MAAHWRNLAEIIEPAFGDADNEYSPIQYLAGQQIARGMPVSPVASFQIVISEAALQVWDSEKEASIGAFLGSLEGVVCSNNQQIKSFRLLMREVFRRSRQLPSYWELWETIRVQRSLVMFLNSMGPQEFRKLASIQEATLGFYNEPT